MDANEKRMVIINSIFSLCSNMASVFLNVFLYTYTGSLWSMALYTILRIGMFPIFFPVAGKIAYKKKYSTTLTIGLILFSFQLIFVLALEKYLGIYPILIYISALLFGMAEGFYYLSINTLNQLVTSPDNVGLYLGYVGMGQNTMNLIAPLIATFIIDSSKTDKDGYILIFQIVLLVYILLAFIASRITTTAYPKPYSLKHCFNFKENKPVWKITLTTSFLYGIHNSMSLILSGLMLYDALGSSGSMYSKLLAIFSIISILSFGIYNHIIKPGQIIKTYIPSGFLMASATIIMVFFENMFGGIYYGILNSVCNAPYNNGYNILSMNVVNEYSNEENITGRVITREIVLSIGRIVGMGLIVILSILFEDHYMKIAVPILSVFAIICPIYTKKAYQKLGTPYDEM